VATSSCPACGANAFVAGRGGGGTCSSCGYSSGEENRCPHCKAVARIEGSGLQAVCAVCGGPRVPENLGGEAAANALREQKKALANARTASVATVLQAIGAAFVTLAGLAAAPESIVGKAIVFALAVVPLFLALRSRGRAQTSRAFAKSAGERAWLAAAEEVAASSKAGVTVPGLAKKLGIEPPHAEKLLTELTVHDRTRIDVGDDAEVRYSTGPSQFRVEAEKELAEESELVDDVGSSEREGRTR
jgi:hypothetical protein